MSSSTPVTRSLPARPDLEQLKHQAKNLLADARDGNDAALQRLEGNNTARLADAQFVIAREHGFASWARIRRAVLAASGADRPVTRPSRVDKHLAASTYNASTFLDGARRNGWEPGRLPTSLVFVFQSVYAHRLAQDPRFVEDTAMAVGNGCSTRSGRFNLERTGTSAGPSLLCSARHNSRSTTASRTESPWSRAKSRHCSPSAWRAT